MSGAALDAAGRIHVLDAQAQQVFVFDSAGTYLHSLGRAGEGPGEFSRPSWLSVHGEQQVLVRDARGISIFHAPGEWLGRHDPSETRTVRSWRVGDRSFIEAAMYGAGRTGIDPRITLVLADSGGVVDTLAVGQAGALYFRTPQMATALAIPLCDLVHAGAAERAGEHATEHVWVRLQGMPDRAAAAGGEADGPEQPPSDPSDEGESWRAIDGTAGEPLLDARFPPGGRISGFGSDASGGARAVGVHLGDLGVQSVRVYRLR